MTDQRRPQGTMRMPKGKVTSHNMAAQQLLDETNALLNQPLFRKFVFRLLEDAGIHRSTFSSGSPHETSFREGRRSLGCELLRGLQMARPDVLALLEAEGHRLLVEEQQHQSQTLTETTDEPEDETPP